MSAVTKDIAIVVGSTGAMGQHITRRLADAGLQVIAVARTADSLNELAQQVPGIRACAANIGDDSAIEAIRAQIDAPVRMLVQGAGVGGQVVTQTRDLHEHRDALAIEQRAVDQLVAGHVLLHLGDHGHDRFGDAGLVRFLVAQALDGVAHDHRRLGRVDDGQRLALARAAHLLDGVRRGVGELVEVGAGAGADGLAGQAGHDLGVAHGLHTADGVDDRNRRLARTRNHVDVHDLLVGQRLQVHRRHAQRADGRGGQVDHQHAQLVELARVLGVHVGAGGVKRDLDAVGLDMRQQAVHAVGRGLEAHVAGAFEAFGFGVDADHPHGFQHGAALDLVDQVGADVARADQGAFDFFHGVSGSGFRRSAWKRCRVPGSGR